jgi:hypothetical protein
MMRLAWSHDSESYAGGRVATGRISHAGQFKGDDPDKKGYPDLVGWWLDIGLTTSPIKTLNVEKLVTIAAGLKRPHGDESHRIRTRDKQL